MEYGEYLYKLRKEKSISQEAVACELNVSRQSVSLWETNQSSPSMENMIALAKLFQVSLDELVGLKEVKLKSEEPLYTSNYVVDKTVVYRRNHCYLFTRKDALLAFVTFFFFIFSLMSFIGSLQVRQEVARILLIIGFISLIVGYLFYPLRMVKDLQTNAKKSRVSLNFYNNHLEMLMGSSENLDIQYDDVEYYIIRRNFAILVKKDTERIYVQIQKGFELDDFLASKITRNTRVKPFWR